MTPPATAAKSRSGLARIAVWSFVVIMLALTGLFTYLGLWQLERLGEKEALMAAVAARAGHEPVALPPVSEWESLDPQDMDFQPVQLTGRFHYDDTVLVFTGLGDAKGQYSGPGYWVMTSFVLADGGAVFVNRGFVPQDRSNEFMSATSPVSDEMTTEGVARAPEHGGSFTPEPDVAGRIDWVRDPQRLAADLDLGAETVADFYVDLPAGEPGQLPQGGETVMDFSNRHLEYAMTWFAFALITPVMLLVWMVRQRRSRPQSNLP